MYASPASLAGLHDHPQLREAGAPGGGTAEGEVSFRGCPLLCANGRAEKRVFRAILTNPGHVFHPSLSREKSTVYNLRPRAQNCELPWKDTRNCLARQLYSNIKCPKHSYSS